MSRDVGSYEQGARDAAAVRVRSRLEAVVFLAARIRRVYPDTGLRDSIASAVLLLDLDDRLGDRASERAAAYAVGSVDGS